MAWRWQDMVWLSLETQAFIDLFWAGDTYIVHQAVARIHNDTYNDIKYNVSFIVRTFALFFDRMYMCSVFHSIKKIDELLASLKKTNIRNGWFLLTIGEIGSKPNSISIAWCQGPQILAQFFFYYIVYREIHRRNELTYLLRDVLAFVLAYGSQCAFFTQVLISFRDSMLAILTVSPFWSKKRITL